MWSTLPPPFTRPKRVDGNRAKFMSRRLRENEYCQATMRNIVA